MANTIHNPSVPFIHGLGYLSPNKMIFISGIPNPNPSRFTVYLQQGPEYEPYTIGTCVDARFDFLKDRDVVVRNHKHRTWGQEERNVPNFPFMPNAPFEMIILIEPHCYKVTVNHKHLFEFYHRVKPLNVIDTLRIDGDLRLTQVRFQ